MNKHYLYSCTNNEDVLFQGAVPITEEYGPFVYQEFDTYENKKWIEVDIPGTKEDR